MAGFVTSQCAKPGCKTRCGPAGAAHTWGWSSDGFFGDAHVGVGHVDPVHLDVAEAFVCIDAGCSLVSAKFDGLEGRPGGVLPRQVVTRRLRGETEDAAWASEDMYLHVSYRLW